MTYLFAGNARPWFADMQGDYIKINNHLQLHNLCTGVLLGESME